MKRFLSAACALWCVGSAAAAHLRHGQGGKQHSLGAAAAPKPNASMLQLGVAAEADGRNANASMLQLSAAAEAQMLVGQLLRAEIRLGVAVKHVHARMTTSEAVRRLHGKLPPLVTALVNSGGSQAPTFTEESMDKARKILNKMVEDSFAQLDDVIIECKAFENMNRVTFGQITTDLGRLGSSLAKSEETITASYNCIGDMDREYKVVQDQLETERVGYEREFAANQAELTNRKNDLVVFDYIMEITKCADGGSFLQLSGNSTAHVKVCSTDDGVQLDFADPKLKAKLAKIMTPGARQAINQALGLAFMSTIPGLVPSALLQKAKSGEPTTTTMHLGVTQSPTPVQEEPPPSMQWRKCTTEPPNCGRLHDSMSLQWGKFKDSVDELQAEMDKNKDAWDVMRSQLNDQMDVISGQKSECQTNFDAGTGFRNTLTTESNEKTQEMHSLSVSYESHMAICKAKVQELLYTDVCAVRSVRDSVMTSSTVSPPSAITDCEVTDWVPELCSVPCDDSCPHRVGGQVDPYSCGGTQVISRSIMVQANEFGIACPAMSKQTRCSQFKCPVDCSMSVWSGWSKCTKDCGGGARTRTRSILKKPNHGGKFCDSPVDTEPCNTGSCDRDCSLDAWSTWSFCSMACNPGGMPGFQERTRKVLVPMRGEGMCPSTDSAERYEKQTCNEQACTGDEICIAKQDLIIAIDASGSLKQSGFEIIRDFAVNLTGSYRSEYYGEPTVQIGVIVFGNGQILPDKTLSPALNIQPLTHDLAAVKTSIEGSSWQKGFTNMAQAFVLADTMLQPRGRAGAQSAVLVLSDGRYSFAFQTQQAVNKLKDKGTMVYMAPISDSEGDWQHKLKEWASQPWETNYERLPGMLTVKHNMALFSAAIVAKFCPDAISPRLEAARDDKRGYALIHEGGFPSDECGRWYDMGLVESQDECARKTQDNANYLAFSVTEPSQWYDGQRHCYAEAITVTEELWEKWLNDRADIPCEGGAWLNNPMYDVFAIEP